VISKDLIVACKVIDKVVTYIRLVASNSLFWLSW